MKTWRARTTKTAIAQVVLLTIPLGVVGLSIELLLDGVSTERLVGVAVALSATAVASIWAYRMSRRGLEIQLVGETLGIKGRGTHRLRPASLMAVRAKDTHGSTSGTFVVVALGNEASRVTLLFPGVVPSDAYFAEMDMQADMWLDPDGNELLDQLAPHLASKPGTERATSVGYAFALRRSLFGSPKADSLSIAGDSVAVGCDGRVVAQARAHEIGFTAYCFERGGEFSNAPALVLEYPSPPFKLTIGAEPMSLEAHWDALTVGEKPEYMMGLGELLRLIAVLEVGRAKFAPR